LANHPVSYDESLFLEARICNSNPLYRN
jgi:hypothetical protein